MTRTRAIFVSGLTALLLALGGMIGFGLGRVQTVSAASVQPGNLHYYNVNGQENSFYFDQPTGCSYSYSNGVLTIGAGAATCEFWTTSPGDLTVNFEANYGRRSKDNIVYTYFILNGGSLTLTSTSPVDVYVTEVYCDGDLTVSGGVNLHVVGLHTYSTTLPDNLISCKKLYVEDDASVDAKDPSLTSSNIFKSNVPQGYCIAKFDSLYLNTTGSFKVGLYDPGMANKVVAIDLSGSVNLTECGGGFELYSNDGDFISLSGNAAENEYDINDYYLTTEATVSGRQVMTITMPVVSFDANGGTGEMEDQPRQKGDYTVPDCAFTAPGGQQFKCWAEGSASGTQYDAVDDYTVTDNVTFYAVWEDIPTDELTGSVGIDGTLKYGQTITATVTDSNNTGTLQYQWLRDGVDIAEANDIAYTLAEEDVGTVIGVTVTSTVEWGSILYTASAAVQKAEGPAAPAGITATACTTSDDNDGTITGVTAAMEYKLSSAAVWTDGTGAVIESLAAGTYNVRVKETATHQAGEIAGVVVRAYGAPTLYTVTVIGGIAEPAQAQAGETVIITADDPEEGFVFYGWSSANVEVAKPTRTTTTFVMPDTDVVVVAEYSPVLYSITVLNGTSVALDCIAGETVIITADDPEEGFVFDRWVSDDVELDKPTRTATTFVMPAKNVVVTATYRAASKGGLGAGAIAGIVIAGVAVLAGAGVGALLLIRKKKIV